MAAASAPVYGSVTLRAVHTVLANIEKQDIVYMGFF